MRWNCPHCGVGLNVPDEQLGESWCFSKCYQCSGFSLVRRTDQNAVRVDGAGAQMGAGVLSESPWRLSQRALDAAKPVIRPATKKVKSPSPVQDLAKEISQAKVIPPPFKTPLTQPSKSSSGLITRSLPPPLPEQGGAAQRRGLVRAVYRVLTRTLATAVLIVVAVGVYTWVTTPIPVSQELGSDLGRKETSSINTEPAVIAKVASDAVVGQGLSIKAPSMVSAPVVVTDSISRGAMAPEREVRSTGFEVEALSPRAQLRSGPGLQYSVVGLVGVSRSYPVVDWSERWFRIAVEKNPDGTPKTFAWIRNDLVKLVKKSR